MTTMMSSKGDIALLVAIREELHLSPGDDFEIEIEDEETITLRRVSNPANHGLIDLLLSCPADFELPPGKTMTRSRWDCELSGRYQRLL